MLRKLCTPLPLQLPDEAAEMQMSTGSINDDHHHRYNVPTGQYLHPCTIGYVDTYGHLSISCILQGHEPAAALPAILTS